MSDDSVRGTSGRMSGRVRPGSLPSALAAVLLALFTAVAPGREAAPASADPVLEARVLAIAEELRCLVCQNETLAASNAALAVDLREQIRRQLTAGRSRDQIVGYMVERYGDFVRYRPPFGATTALLWGGPFLLLGLGSAAMAVTVRRRRLAATGGGTLSAADADRARRLLRGGSEA